MNTFRFQEFLYDFYRLFIIRFSDEQLTVSVSADVFRARAEYGLSYASAPPPSEGPLSPGGWNPAVRERLNALIERNRGNPDAYAVFDFGFLNISWTVPLSSTTPSLITATLSHICSTTRISCVIMTIVTPRFLLISLSS